MSLLMRLGFNLEGDHCELCCLFLCRNVFGECCASLCERRHGGPFSIAVFQTSGEGIVFAYGECCLGAVQHGGWVLSVSRWKDCERRTCSVWRFLRGNRC